MSWDTILFLSILGMGLSFGVTATTIAIGIRYRRELPKLPLVRSIEALEEQRQSLEADLDKLQDSLYEARNLIKEGQDARRWIEESQERIAQLRAELAELEPQRLELDRVREQLQQSTERLRSVQEEHQALSNDLDRLRAERDELIKTRDELTTEIQELEARRADMNKTIAALDDKQTQLRESLDRMDAKRTELEAQISAVQGELEPLLTKRAELTGEVNSLTSERDRLQAAIRSLKEDYRAAGGSVPADSGCLDELFVPYIDTRAEPGGPSDEQERLLHTERQLDGSGFRVPRRLLLAFHTSLKIQDMSPLTVLAGISGTGKSLLPYLYARCMGLHFLNLPVQPGWNSPQDLFGFYNYVEQRYKATPLARALLQFAQYDRPPDAKPQLSDQLLLVLLDELNLARVEYYFSELLSRLELRRSVDLENEMDRQSLAIPLELPMQSDDGEEAREQVRLFCGNNVLFVGTINEDESTLSLSDKVLDRATVLRFGAPLKPLPTKPDLTKLTPSAPLSFDVWLSWLSAQSNPLPQQIERLLTDNLPGLLRALDLPLGHRAAQGLRLYLQLYPRLDSGQSYLHALADQIEQRVLPRLRGRDLATIEEPLARLRNFVETELGDEELASAIRDCLSTDTGVFLWRGLDRSDSS